jgi:hypothetical protein
MNPLTFVCAVLAGALILEPHYKNVFDCLVYVGRRQWCIAAHASDKSDMLLAHWKKFVEWKKRLRRGEVNA